MEAAFYPAPTPDPTNLVCRRNPFSSSHRRASSNGKGGPISRSLFPIASYASTMEPFALYSINATRYSSASVTPVMRAAIVVLLLLSKARLAAFISLNRRTTDRPLRPSQTSRAAPTSDVGTKRSNSAPTRSSRVAEVWFEPTIGSSDTRRYARQDATTSSVPIQRGCLPILCLCCLSGSRLASAEVKASILCNLNMNLAYGGCYGYVKSRHKLPEFMAAVTVCTNVMVVVAPVGDTFSTVTITY
jgi:hypothetical protein